MALTSWPLLTASAAADEPSATSQDKSRVELNVPRQEWTGDLDGMIARRRIRVLVPYSKSAYWVDLGKPRGLLYEVFTEFEKDLNRRARGPDRRLKIHVVFLPMRPEEFVPALLEGRGDIVAAGLTITDERNAKVDFSDPILTDVREIVVTGPQSPSVATLDDLAGQEVFVRRSSSYFEHLTALNEARTKNGQPLILIREVSDALTDDDLLQMVDAGLLGITVIDEFRVEQWAKALKNLQIHTDMVIHAGGDIAWMVRKDSPQLKARLDAFIKTHGRKTRFGAVLFRKYLTKPPVLRSATSPRELKKFDRTVGIFRKYGDKYDVDHLLMVAQGYQESRLDQGAKSPVGAIGVMQLMPETGRELAVGDIHQLEPNIHGGVKYVRRIIDRYYAEAAIDRLNQVFFAFAAYNCGPGRVRSLRREAGNRGLDPNRWFNNVEIVAADRVGPEPVTYVANILKYYTAYKDHEEHGAPATETSQAPP
jgi:membrane-bound lytic murein transglycosylase MltF